VTATNVPDHQHRCAPASGRVASYETAYAAQLAVDHLAERGVASDTLQIIPADVHTPVGWRELTGRQPRPVRPFTVGVIVTASALAVMAVTPTLTVITPLAVTFAAVSAVYVAARIDRWEAARVRRRARTSRAVEADRFDVVCTGATKRAEHLLARWWNPEAQPVASHRRAHADGETVAERRLSPAA
jgi:hypothetical protein